MTLKELKQGENEERNVREDQIEEARLQRRSDEERLREAVVRRCSVKEVFLEISQKSQKTPVPESPF